MKIILGQDLDGSVYRAAPSSGATAGTVTAGTAGFLDLLELLYGFPEKEASALRVFQYERALREVDTGKGLHSASFAVDPFGVAQTFLEARDELLLSAPSGFSLQTMTSAGGRLGAIAAAESGFLRLDPEPGVPDRILRVLSSIRGSRVRSGIEEIALVDELSSWHLLFRELIGGLASLGVRIVPYPHVYPEHRTGDLLTVAESLLDRGPADRTALSRPVSDGSLVLLRAPTPAEAADLTAALFFSGGPEAGRTVVINPGLSTHLDDACMRAGLPLVGGRYVTAGYPILQILPLLLRLQFAPVDPALLREYLLLPVSPLPVERRRVLLDALRDSPGVGGERWRRLLAATVPEENVLRRLSIGVVPRGARLPASDILRLAGAFEEWMTSLLRAGEDRKNEDVKRGSKQARLIAEAIALRNSSDLTEVELTTFLADLGKAFAVRRPGRAEAGAPYAVAAPAAVLDAADTVVYANFTESGMPVSRRNHFISRERKLLEDRGVVFLDQGAVLDRHFLDVTRAVRYAAKRLVLVLPETAGGEPESPHPLWYRMARAFADEPDPRSLLELDGAGRLPEGFPAAGPSASGVSGIGSIPVASALHPASVLHPRGKPVYFDPLIRIGSGIGIRKTESPSSIEKLLGCPLAYVLTYGAALGRRESELPGGGLLYGRIAHDVIEGYLELDRELTGRAPDEEPLESRVERHIREHASVLLADGMDAERKYLVQRIAEAGTALERTLRTGGYRILGIEKRLTRPADGTEIAGIADIVVERKSDGRKAVIDLKWSGDQLYRDLLSGGRALQVATYSFLLDGARAPAAYFIIRTGRFLTVHRGLFPGAGVIEGPPESEVWEAIARSLQERIEDLRSGVLPVGLTEELWKARRKDRSLPGEGEGDGEGDSPGDVPEDPAQPDFLVHAPCRFCEFGLFCGVERKET